VLPLQCMVKLQCERPPVRCERQVEPPLADCLLLYTQKSHRGQPAHRAHTGASCSAISAEYFLDFFIGRQVPPGGTLFDKLPLFIGDIVVTTAPFNLADESCDSLLIVGRPTEHAIEDLFDLISCHDGIVPGQAFKGYANLPYGRGALFRDRRCAIPIVLPAQRRP
jgi:hypothetical protein